MTKLMAFVAILVTLSYGSNIPIDLIVPAQGWSHDSASLVRVNLDSYIPDGEVLETAVLKFTGVQNYMEPENNDILYIDLLKVNSGWGQQQTSFYYDDEDASNYFKVRDDIIYEWVDGESALGTYTDDNDKNIKIDYEWKPAYWERTNPSHEWRYEYWDNNRNQALWSHISGYTPENFDIALNVETINRFKSDNGWIGIGLDADCHYTGRVTLEISTKTTNVPEPSLVSILGCSLLGLVFVRKKK